MSHLFKASLVLTVFFAINKIIALARQTLIANQFGFGAQIDAFNVANNLPDLMLSLFSGGALALAFIPVFAEYIKESDRVSSWKLFSKTANILFLATAVVSIILFIAARPIVASKFGISPGFSPTQQDLVVSLMQINFLAMILFSMSGMVTASLQAHKHFLLTALAPILYNIGVIIGTVILAPQVGYEVLGIRLPSMGLGIYGLAYGTVIGALFHLGIQIPGLIRYQFRWTPSLGFKDTGVQKVLRLMAPRILTVFLIQVIFVARDNFASYLAQGSVTTLTYGFFIVQVPETLIGTAIATALLPTLSHLVSSNKRVEFANVINRAIRVMIASTVVISALLALTLPQFIDIVFNFNPADSNILVWTTRAYLIGLMSHVLLEVAVRVFYAQQNAKIPLVATCLRLIAFFVYSFIFMRFAGVAGLAIADSIAVSIEVAFLFFILYKKLPASLAITDTLIRTVIGCIISTGIVYLILTFLPIPSVPLLSISLLAGCGIYSLFITKELRILLRL